MRRAERSNQAAKIVMDSKRLKQFGNMKISTTTEEYLINSDDFIQMDALPESKAILVIKSL